MNTASCVCWSAVHSPKRYPAAPSSTAYLRQSQWEEGIGGSTGDVDGAASESAWWDLTATFGLSPTDPKTCKV